MVNGKGDIDYQGVANACAGKTGGADAFNSALLDALPDLWCEQYRAMPNDRVDIVQLNDGTYEFLFDLVAERVVAAFGTSGYNPGRRDSSRMAGFLPRTDGMTYRERFFASHGHRYDRGHFMSHRQAGGLDINLFPQRADVNQGHSARGKKYRAMETEAATHRNTFVFSRPLYDDRTWVPAELEYGLLYDRNHLDVELFPNK